MDGTHPVVQYVGYIEKQTSYFIELKLIFALEINRTEMQSTNIKIYAFKTPMI